MYAAVMSGNGTLGTWLSQSVVGHAVSKTGPQVRALNFAWNGIEG